MVLVDWAAQNAEPKVHEIKTLGWEGDAQVKTMLTRCALQVQPIMRKRGWRVPLLQEFYPAQSNLLGLNKGGGGGSTLEVSVRVRRAGDKSSFLPEHSVLGTLLHELVHNVRGPHDAVFYKLLDEITEECEDLMDRGVTGSGAGFEGPSQGRLGSHCAFPQHNPPESQLRLAALKAAEGRAKRARLMSQGGQRLGGALSGSAWRHLTPAQAAARAAERRAADDRWCPCGGPGGGANDGQAQPEGIPIPESGGAGPSSSTPDTTTALPPRPVSQVTHQVPGPPSAHPTGAIAIASSSGNDSVRRPERNVARAGHGSMPGAGGAGPRNVPAPVLTQTARKVGAPRGEQAHGIKDRAMSGIADVASPSAATGFLRLERHRASAARHPDSGLAAPPVHPSAGPPAAVPPASVKHAPRQLSVPGVIDLTGLDDDGGKMEGMQSGVAGDRGGKNQGRSEGGCGGRMCVRGGKGHQEARAETRAVVCLELDQEEGDVGGDGLDKVMGAVRGAWTCAACTFLNVPPHSHGTQGREGQLACDMCGTAHGGAVVV